jgi:septal ring factor EnvC (AmiA/AmiB activator)
VTAPTGEPPLDALPPDAPATVEDVRVSRRWMWVALAWAVAASIIAGVALIQANNAKNDNNSPPQQTRGVSAQQLNDLQKQVNDRMDAFSRRLKDTATAGDVQKLDKRVTALEKDLQQTQNDASTESDTVKQMQSDIKDLQQRVGDLEQQQNSSGTNTGTTTTP